MPVTRRSLLGLTLLVGWTLVGCGLGDKGNVDSGIETIVRVGSKDFTEQFILGEMYALILEEHGLEVERKLNLGGTPVAHAGLQNDEIDVYPEYTGTGLLTVLKLPANSDRQAVYDTVAEGYRSQFGLIWLDPAPMNNTQALAVTQEVADEYELINISDLAAVADRLVMIGPPEFVVREDGLPSIQAAYGDFELADYKGVDPGLRYLALVNGEADVAVAFGTDGEISAYDLVVLTDDLNVFPPYQVAPVIRQEVLDAHPKVAEALNALAPLLTDTTMQRLNNEVSGEQREPEDVALEFLLAEGLVDPN